MATPFAAGDTTPSVVQQIDAPAVDFRRGRYDAIAPGVAARSAFAMTLTGGMGTSFAKGRIYVRGGDVVEQGLYEVWTNAAKTVTVNAADGSLPRIDQAILRVFDSTHDSSGLNTWRIEVVPGTPTSGATLDNRSGADPLTGLSPNSKSIEPLYDILVPAASASVSAGNVRDRRGGIEGVILDANFSAADTYVDLVNFQPLIGMYNVRNAKIDNTYDLRQAAALMFLPRDISADRVVFGFRQDDTTGLAGTWNMGIHDQSTRLIVSTGAQTLASTAGAKVRISQAISLTTFVAGYYYVSLGLNTTNAGSMYYIGTYADTADNLGNIIMAPSVFGHSTTGGTTIPTTLRAFTEGYIAASGSLPVPIIALGKA